MIRTAHAALGGLLLCAASACSPGRLQAVELTSSTLSRQLLAHWSFDDPPGMMAHDDSGNSRDGQLTGGMWLTDGQFGGALHLGDGESVSVPRFPDATSSFTVSAWVRLSQYTQTGPSGSHWTTVVSTELTGGWEINVDHSGPTPALHFGFWKGPGQGDYESLDCAGPQLGVWTQVAGVVDLSTSSFSVYVDGLPCGSLVTAHLILPGSATLTIGEWPNTGRYLAGDVDDIAIWGRALVPDEVKLVSERSVPPAI